MSETRILYTFIRAKKALKEIEFKMIIHMFFSLFAVVNLLLPADIQSALANETNLAQAETKNEELQLPKFENYIKDVWNFLTEEEQPVTTLETDKRAAAEAAEPEQELTREEEQLLAFKEWQMRFPVFEEASTQTEFIETIAPAAVLIADEHDIYPSVMIAQASLESSWGQSELAQTYNNLMGTKGSWEGESVTARTREDVAGDSIYIQANFSVYDSWADSLYRYGNLMKNGLEWDAEYYSGTWRENTESYTDATAWLQDRYATDSAYADKLNETIQSYDLERYDEMEAFDESLEKTLAQLHIEDEK